MICGCLKRVKITKVGEIKRETKILYQLHEHQRHSKCGRTVTERKVLSHVKEHNGLDG
ncbi:hypothetical protein P7K49_019657, partial [Saguinus oedipus]